MSEAANDVVVVLSTFPDAAAADAIAGRLVDERLCACVNLVPAVTSIYRWQGAVVREAEVLAIIKTVRSRLSALTERIAGLHPYQVPEILALEPTSGGAAYLDWVRRETGPRTGP